MRTKQSAPPGENCLARWGRFALLHPALLLCLPVICWSLVRPVRLPEPTSAVVEVTGMIRTLPEIQDGSLRFEVEPREVRREPAEVPVPGRILVTIAPGQIPFGQMLDPELRPGERVVFRAALQEPGFHAVPGVVDQRREALARGLYWRAHLKSPLQLERTGPESGLTAAVLRWTSSYLTGFRRYLWEAVEPGTAAWIDGLLLALRSGIPPERWEGAAEVGVVHLLVVSGLHVGLIAGAAYCACRGLGGAAAVLVWGFVGLYVTLLGFPPPATRAALMIGLGYVALASGIQFRPLNALGAAALALVWPWPEIVHSRSFQFTFASVAALLLLGAPAWRELQVVIRGAGAVGSRATDLRPAPAHRIARRIRFCLEGWAAFFPGGYRSIRAAAKPAGLLLSPVVAGGAILLGNLPVLLEHTQLFPTWSLPANLVLLPAFSLLLPASFVLLLVYWTPAADLAAPVVDFSAGCFDRLLDWVSSWQGGIWSDAPGVPAILVYVTLLLFAGLWLPRAWKLLMLLLPLLLLGWTRFPRPADGDLVVTLLDIGQGDAVHLRYPDGSHGLVDTGGSRFDRANRFVARRVLAPYLLGEGARWLDYVLISHPEADHMGSLPALARVLPPRFLLLHEAAPRLGAVPVHLEAGDRWRSGEVEHEVLHPDRGETGLSTNDRSLVVRIRYRTFTLLLTGDIGAEVERRIAGRLAPVAVLKVPHHGSRSSTSHTLLAAVRPQVALISAGRRNAFGHPSPRVTGRLDGLSIPWFATSTAGSLRVRTDGWQWQLSGYCPERGQFVPLAESGEGSREANR